MGWTVNRRIWIGFGIALALVAFVAAVGIAALAAMRGEYRAAMRQQQESLAAVEGLAEFSEANLDFVRYLLQPDDRWLAGRGESLAAARAALRELPGSADDRARAARLLDEWERASQESVDAMRAGDRASAVRIRDQRSLPASQGLRTLIDGRVEDERGSTADALRRADEEARRSEWMLGIGALIAIVAGTLAAAYLSRAISGPLRETTGTLASSATEILAATSQQAAGATQTSAAVAETAATVDEVAQTAEQAAERARMVAETATRAADIGRQGRAAVDRSIGAMQSVDRQVGSIAASILALAEQAQSIGEIIASVDDIAGQTNLLALNAAIEASRAGEAGRGFAVVAGEIRSLAEQSKKATVQVRQILGEIQRATSAAVMSTEEGTKQVAAGTRQVTEAGETIRTLAEVVAEAAQASVQIAASSGQQSAGMAQIRQAMTQIQQASHQNLSAVRQTERAAQELSRLGEGLLRLVGGSPNGARA
jgi:Methyl-accepting chemotaxis protein (MCP) signalling domain